MRESDTDGTIMRLVRSDCFLPPRSICRLRQGRDICARHGRSELMNKRRGNERENFVRSLVRLDLDLGQSGLDLQTTEFIPAGAINPEIGVFLWPKSMRQTRRRVLYGQHCLLAGLGEPVSPLGGISTFLWIHSKPIV